MRQGSRNESIARESNAVTERLHERTGRSILCAIYNGILGTGVRTPGVLKTTTADRRPLAYVVPITVLREANIIGLLDDIIPSASQRAAGKWAKENVKGVIIDSLGLNPEDILEGFFVKVPYPFWTATSGELVPKAGRATSDGAVPQGETDDDVEMRNILNKDIAMGKRLREAIVRYREPGVPYNGSREEFPKPGENWIR